MAKLYCKFLKLFFTSVNLFCHSNTLLVSPLSATAKCLCFLPKPFNMMQLLIHPLCDVYLGSHQGQQSEPDLHEWAFSSA